MPGHTRLYRRGAVYYHRAAVPQDIAETYGKREETFSVKIIRTTMHRRNHPRRVDNRPTCAGTDAPEVINWRIGTTSAGTS